MSFFSLLAALLLEQLYSLPIRQNALHWFTRYADWLERRLNAGELSQGVIAALLALLPPVALAGAIYWLLYDLHPLLAWGWNVVILYLTMGFRRFSHAFTEIGAALHAGDVALARAKLAEWRGESGIELSGNEVARLTIEQGLWDAHRNVFGVMFWFLLLPGPTGALLYRCAEILDRRWKRDGETGAHEQFGRFGHFPQRFFYYLDWIPVRLTALSFAIVGDFEDALHCWRTQAASWSREEEGVILASGGGALGVRLGEPLREVGGGVIYRPELGVGEPAEADYLESAVGLIWRALVLWLVVVFLLSLARWLA